ncbi:hypothetical protein V9T40_010484 [Parthenolecanium corni]|uniref:Uncharacterized protein n=1 Tax=Parthenolecanium corni TaxID=536013 RepID=A0AAN9T917_9HEMI
MDSQQRANEERNFGLSTWQTAKASENIMRNRNMACAEAVGWRRVESVNTIYERCGAVRCGAFAQFARGLRSLDFRVLRMTISIGIISSDTREPC